MTSMDDRAALERIERILTAAQNALVILEEQAAIYTSATIPVPLKMQLDEKRQHVTDLEEQLKQLIEKQDRQVAQAGISRQSAMRSPVPDEYYIERDEAKRLLKRFATALEQPQGQPLLFNICGIGGVGKTTLLRQLQKAHAGNVDFLEVCFAKTHDIETPLKLMRKLHQEAMELGGAEISADRADPFSQRDRQFATALLELSRQSVDGRETSSEEARKITSWFERLVWLGPIGFTSVSNKPKPEVSRAGFSAFAAMENDTEGWQEWIEQRVRNHPATKDRPELEALMLEPVSQLTQAFAESLMQIAQSRARPLVLVLDTYEKAQAYMNQWLWQYLVEDTPLSSTRVRLAVVGRRSLQADEVWRKLNQDRKLLYKVELAKFSNKDTQNYLQQVGIKNGGDRAKIYKATKGLPYYLDWVRGQYEKGEELDFSQGNQAIAELLLQGLESQQRKILQVVACCRWFDEATIRYLLGNDSLGWQQDADKAENIFAWLKGSDFVEFSQGHYRLDDVARDVFRQSYFQSDRNQFRQTHALLADYFKQQADDIFAPESLLPDPYEEEEWRELMAESLYHGLFGKRREGLYQYIEQVFAAVYLQQPDLFAAPFAFISAEISEENQELLSNKTIVFLNESSIILDFGWFFLNHYPNKYQIEFEDDSDPSAEDAVALLKQIETSIQSLLRYVGNLENGLGKCAGLVYKSLGSHRFSEIKDLLLEAKGQIEQLLDRCRPQLLHSLFSKLGSLLNDAERYEDALDCYQKALKLGQGNASIFFGQGVALFYLEQYEEALKSFDKEIELAPESADAWVNRGATLDRLERSEETAESFQKAINLDPHSVNAWVGRSHTLRVTKRYKDALVAHDRALKIDSKNSYALNSQALTLSLVKDFDKAITAIDQAIALETKKVVLRANRGIILARAGRYAEALADCEQAIQQNPQDESGYYAKACYYALQGELEPAIDNLQKAVDIAPRISRTEAKHNPDFDSIRDDEGFRALVYPESKG